MPLKLGNFSRKILRFIFRNQNTQKPGIIQHATIIRVHYKILFFSVCIFDIYQRTILIYKFLWCRGCPICEVCWPSA